jgi:hypothetical protein
MIRAIITAVAGALRKAFGALRGLAAMPFRALASIGGGGGWSMPDAPTVGLEDADNDRATAADRRMADGLTMANLMLSYAADSVVEDRPADVPAGLTPELKRWAQGLSRDECETLLMSDERGISAHIQGVFHLPGVRRAAPLPPARWSQESSPAHDDDLEFSSAALPAL